MPSESARRVTTRSTTRRFWRRVETPAIGWWPWGWLPLAGLVLATCYGLIFTVPDIQANTAQSVARALAGSGYPDLDVIANGQQVIVRGQGDASDQARIANVARGARCSVLAASDLVCPRGVRVELEPKAGRAQVKALPARRDPHPLRDTDVDAQALQVAPVPTPARQTAPDVLAAQTAPGPVQVTEADAIVLAARNSRDPVPAVDGESETVGSGNTLADRVVPQVETCNEQFASALTATTIRFQFNSSAISSDSQPLLQRLAELANECPMALDIEGHTDTSGALEWNQRLSLARAQAVAAALEHLGVDGARMTPRGIGPARPVADNTTREGRIRNRRIEIRVTGSTVAGAQVAPDTE